MKFLILAFVATIPMFAEASTNLGACEKPVKAQLHRRLGRAEIAILDCNRRREILVCEGAASNGDGAGDIDYVIGVNRSCQITFYREAGRE